MTKFVLKCISFVIIGVVFLILLIVSLTAKTPNGTWKTGNWSDCQSDGKQTRTWICPTGDSCKITDKPADESKNCVTPTDPTKGDWQPGNWSACQSDGKQTRTWICPTGDSCKITDKPADESKNCGNIPSSTYRGVVLFDEDGTLAQVNAKYKSDVKDMIDYLVTVQKYAVGVLSAGGSQNSGIVTDCHNITLMCDQMQELQVTENVLGRNILLGKEQTRDWLTANNLGDSKYCKDIKDKNGKGMANTGTGCKKAVAMNLVLDKLGLKTGILIDNTPNVITGFSTEAEKYPGKKMYGLLAGMPEPGVQLLSKKLVEQFFIDNNLKI
jgi:hypothetical protein